MLPKGVEQKAKVNKNKETLHVVAETVGKSIKRNKIEGRRKINLV